MTEHEPEGSLSHSTLRSHASMRGLLLAEVGDAMVELDISGGGSGFKEGQRINFATITPGINSSQGSIVPGLARHGTLLSVDATPERNAAELKSILGNSHARLKPGSSLLPAQGLRVHNRDEAAAGEVSLEQAKPRARVEVDIVLRSNTCVQGGYLQGHIKIRIRKRTKKQATILISGGKVRVVGFECISNESERQAFYQYSEPLANISDTLETVYMCLPDADGFAQAREGVHVLPFSMLLPLSSDHGAPKGVLPTQSGAAIRYIAMVSFKVKDQSTNQRSIAHFYRHCEIWPRLNPSLILAPALTPLKSTHSKSLFMGGTGKVTLTASIHRLHWIAGQQCIVNVQVTNNTKKTIKSLTLTLLRSTVVFKPHPHLDALPGGVDHEVDPDACQTSTIHKQIAESTLEMGQRGARGHASAKGWWTGVRPGERQEFAHFVLIPPDALSITRGRLLEIEHSLRVSISAGTLTPDIQVCLPIRIVNFLSVDPPPNTPPPGQDGGLRRSDAALVTETHVHARPVVHGLFGSESTGPGNGGLASLAEDEDEAELGHEDYLSDSEDLEREYSCSEDDEYFAEPRDGQDMTLDYGLEIEDMVNSTPQEDLFPHPQADNGYGDNALRFSDLYYQTAHEAVIGKSTDEQPVLDPSSVEKKVEDLELEARRPSRPGGPSSFARRVQEKLDAISHAPADSAILDILPSTSGSPSASGYPSTSTPAVELKLEVSSICVAEGGGHGSAFSAASVRGSRMLPKLPGGPKEFAMVQKLAGTNAGNQSEDHEPVGCTKPVGETQEKRPMLMDPLSPAGETNMAPALAPAAPVERGRGESLVQRKIRELEERTRMAG